MIKSIAKRMLPGSVQGAIRAVRLRRVLSHFQPRIVRRTYAGKQIAISITDPVAAQWYDLDWAQLPEIDIMKGRSLQPGAMVFDCGAHQGVVAMMLAEQVSPGGRVIAVEANERNASVCRENAALNGYDGLETLNEAVASRPGTIAFNRALNGQVDKGTGSHGVVEVRATTIDELAERFGMPDVVFIDVEGFECEALKGAARVLGHGADFFVEVHGGVGLEDFGGSIEQVLAFFPSARFALHHQPDVNMPYVAFDPTIDRRGQRWCLVALDKGRRPPLAA